MSELGADGICEGGIASITSLEQVKAIEETGILVCFSSLGFYDKKFYGRTDGYRVYFNLMLKLLQDIERVFPVYCALRSMASYVEDMGNSNNVRAEFEITQYPWSSELLEQFKQVQDHWKSRREELQQTFASLPLAAKVWDAFLESKIPRPQKDVAANG